MERGDQRLGVQAAAGVRRFTRTGGHGGVRVRCMAMAAVFMRFGSVVEGSSTASKAQSQWSNLAAANVHADGDEHGEEELERAARLHENRAVYRWCVVPVDSRHEGPPRLIGQ